MALTRLWRPSPHYSTGRSSVRLIVLHTTEGAQDIESLANWFKNPSSKVSSHTGADNKRRGTIAEYVKRNHSAWAQGNYNGVSICIEMCTPSGAANGWSRDYWLSKQGWLLDNTADWIAEEARAYGIPIVKLNASQAQGSGRGLCGHVDIQPKDRTDPGKGFPWDYVIAKATGGKPPTGGTAPSPPKEEDMSASSVLVGGDLHMACVWSDGRINYKSPAKGAVWQAVDPNPNAKAKSGAHITASSNLLVITYTNSGGKVCTYQRSLSGGSWNWYDRGGNAK